MSNWLEKREQKRLAREKAQALREAEQYEKAVQLGIQRERKLRAALELENLFPNQSRRWKISACSWRLQAQQLLGGRCVVCDEIDPRVLELDHIHTNGKQHRADVGKLNLEKWAIDNPEQAQEQLQLLCANCHKAKTYGARNRATEAHRLLGGQCEICENPDDNALEFAHRYDDGKEHRKEVGDIATWVLSVGAEEASQRIALVCASCHARIHSQCQDIWNYV